MKFELEEFHRNVSDEDLIEDLRRVAMKLGKSSVTIDEYNERGKFHNTTFTRRFGSWFTCLGKAGLERTRNLNIPTEDLFQNLEGMWKKLSRQPRYNDMVSSVSMYSAGTYERRFGSWRGALESFIKVVDNSTLQTNDLNDDISNVKSSKEEKQGKRTINWRLRFLVMRRDNFKCKICGASPATNPEVLLHIDHIQPWSKGGKTVIENLQTLCSICNIGKSDL
ncbi:HNH endonuclease [Desulfosporosinus sp. Sb-LF]|uniref:homing endonuclease associated repeat-containing protein n=1 Tax=Desulfosporosinus sp. Sb-LF TaxID=2560027 RepID=UPI00107F97E9|nr:HNH endonuclease [Desulfosporosinus sp. Sb-LF]TGE34257.1 HNH endonuclease [Desulfosporosinus sp. Sb-LF]